MKILKHNIFCIFITILLMLLIQACEYKQEDSEPKAVDLRTPIASASQASAFLTRATFGSRLQDIDDLLAMQYYDKWLDKQIHEIPASYHFNYLNDKLQYSDETWNELRPEMYRERRKAWFDIAVTRDDQLRQRVAFALSEIVVISDYGPLVAHFHAGMAVYYDILVKNAFGNYRDILEEITYNPSMGLYLGMSSNAKAGTVVGSHADENYAREIMQLFSLGLTNLNLDGSSQGTPTYTQKDIENLARVFTGWSGNHTYFTQRATAHQDKINPMKLYSGYHDFTSKSFLGKEISSNLSPSEDITRALDIIYAHPNIAPFVSKHLIQRLVTSNPSPAYIERVAKVFNDNGSGVKGDLEAVVKAILLDQDAIHGKELYPNNFGKLREPLIRLVQLYRTFEATGIDLVQNGVTYTNFGYSRTRSLPQNAAMNSTTVFNYFSPDFRPIGSELVAPEFQISSPLSIITQDNFILAAATNQKLNPISAQLHFDDEIALSSNPKSLIDRLDLLLMSSSMSNSMKEILITYAESNPELDKVQLVGNLVGLIIVSSEYAIQR